MEIAALVVGVIGVGWAVSRMRTRHPLVATLPLLVIALIVAVGGARFLAVLHVASADEDFGSYAVARASPWIVQLPFAAWMAVVPAATILCFRGRGEKRGKAPGIWVALAVAAPWIELAVHADVTMALLRSVTVLVAGIGLVRTHRSGNAHAMRTAAIAFSVLVGLDEAAGLGESVLHRPADGAVYVADGIAAGKRRAAELLGGFTLVVTAVGALPVRRAGTWADMLAPAIVVCAAALCDPVPALRYLEREATSPYACIRVRTVVMASPLDGEGELFREQGSVESAAE